MQENDDDGAGLIHQVASPLAETEPRPIMKCRHCAEDIRQDDDGEWMDRETFHSCDLEPPAPKHAPCGHGWHWGAKCDEPAKPETGPMRNAESPSGVQELGSSGLATAIQDITDLRDGARNVESSEKDHLMWLWRGKAIAYETVLGRLSRVGYHGTQPLSEAGSSAQSASAEKTLPTRLSDPQEPT